MQKKKANSQNNEKKKGDVCGENGAAEKDRCYTYMVQAARMVPCIQDGRWILRCV